MSATSGRAITITILSVATILMTSCGDGGGSGSPGTGTSEIFSSGAVTAIGSVTVNGIKFEDTAADITGDDTVKVLADIRKLGVILRIRGRINADGVSGWADRIEVENELRGAISSITLPDSFTALGQVVVVDGATVFDDTTGLTGASPLVVDDVVEVHGARDAVGQIRATRVERMGGEGIDELKGIITHRTGTLTGTVTIGGAVLSYDLGTDILPPGASFGVGTLVELHLTGTHITRLEVEDLDEPEFKPSQGAESRIEGIVTGFTSLASPFFISGQTVSASGAKFEGGVPADLLNDVRVEAEGQIVGGILVARKIEFRDSLRIQSTVASGGVAAGSTGSFELLGKMVLVTGITENNHGTVAIGDPVEIRGFLNADGESITASRIDSVSSIDADKHIIQGPVTSKNDAPIHFTILGIDVNASGPGVEFQDRNDAPMTPAAFLASVIPGHTIVKARGTPGTGTLVANELELE